MRREGFHTVRVLNLTSTLSARAAVAAADRGNLSDYMSPTAFAKSVINDPLYRKRVRAQAILGTLDSRIEVLLWHYAEGKPTVRLELGQPGAFGRPALENLTDAELRERMKSVTALMLEAADELDELDEPVEPVQLELQGESVG